MITRPAAAAALTLLLVLAACSTPAASSSPGSTPAGSPAPAASSSPGTSLATIGQPADDGARIVNVETLDPRTKDITIESPVVGTVKTRLLLPSSFADQPNTKFPLLLLLHGGAGNYTDWTSKTDVASLTAPTNLIVAMPAAATSNLGNLDPKNGGTGGVGKWATFHLTELLQLLERNWQAGDQRAVAGLSMGGFGTVTYGEQRPDLFKAVASFSGGPLDLRSLVAMQADPKRAGTWGDITLSTKWDEIDPVKNIDKLAGKALYFSFGNGQPGPLDPGRTDVDELEQVVGGGDRELRGRSPGSRHPDHRPLLRPRHALVAVLGARAAQ